MKPNTITEQLALWGEELRAMCQNGLLYSKDSFDITRYQRIQQISAELASLVSGGVPAEIVAEFQRLPGYATPKVGIAAAIFDAQGQMLLIQRADNHLWAMPGGWADVSLRPAEVAVKEVLEETGLHIKIERLLGVYDGQQNNFQNFYHLYHLVFSGTITGGTPTLAPDETLAMNWYTEENLPTLSPGHDHAILDAFRRRRSTEPFFDPPRDQREG
jgi:ADP-ribose pyrophosphatase YjhB (NUDIX family)